MKKILGILFVALFLLTGSTVWSQTIQYSGLTTSDWSVTSKPGLFYGCVLISSASTASIIIYDAASAVTGKEIWMAEVGLTNKCPPSQPSYPIEYRTGLYADVTGTGSNYIIYFSPR